MKKDEYYLIQLAEECSEVQKNIMKALRFGLEDCNPKRPDKNNVELIEEELIDLEVAIDLVRTMVQGIPLGYPTSAISNRHEKVEKWYEYAHNLGRIDD